MRLGRRNGMGDCLVRRDDIHDNIMAIVHGVGVGRRRRRRRRTNSGIAEQQVCPLTGSSFGAISFGSFHKPAPPQQHRAQQQQATATKQTHHDGQIIHHPISAPLRPALTLLCPCGYFRGRFVKYIFLYIVSRCHSIVHSHSHRLVDTAACRNYFRARLPCGEGERGGSGNSTKWIALQRNPSWEW